MIVLLIQVGVLDVTPDLAYWDMSRPHTWIQFSVKLTLIKIDMQKQITWR